MKHNGRFYLVALAFMPKSFFSFTLPEFEEYFFNEYGKKAYYSHAIFKQIYRKGDPTLGEMPEFKKVPDLQKVVLGEMDFEPLPVVKVIEEGELTKFITKTHDELEIESVIIPMSHYLTICISSQVGCKMGCDFCETAQMGLIRSLEVEEIISQVYNAIYVLGFDVRNIVFMGMGEPFDNFDCVIKSIEVLTEQKGLSFGKSNITVSTVGRVDGIRKLAALNWPRLNLAISLNATNDALRDKLMPINRKVPLKELQQALVEYPRRKSGLCLIEYVLIKNVNDKDEHIEELIEFLKPLRARVNLIAYNPRLESPFEAPSQEEVNTFYQKLVDKGVFVCRRMTKGSDVMAACGQLGNRELREQVRARKAKVL